jgi:O-succinylbenzoate synthase
VDQFSFKIHPFSLHQQGYGPKEGVLLEGPDGEWAEVSPLPGRSQETLAAAISQLKAVQQGYQGPLFPSVAFGLFGLKAPRLFQAPVALFLAGDIETITEIASRPYGCKVAKVKIAPFDLSTAVSLVQHLKKTFHLRIDVGAKWEQDKLFSFLSHFSPDDFEFIEDPGFDITPFPMASDEFVQGGITIWKPMVKGLPPPQAQLILSSSYESAIGLHQIAALDTPPHALGIGTFVNLREDVLQEELVIEDGMVKFPRQFTIKERQKKGCIVK